MSETTTRNPPKRKLDDGQARHPDATSGGPIKKIKIGEGSKGPDEEVEAQLAPSADHYAQSLSQSNNGHTAGDGASNDTSSDEGSDDDKDEYEEYEEIIEDEEDYDGYFSGYNEVYEDDDDDDSGEYEIDESEQVIPGNPEQVVKLRVAVCKEDEFEDWLENIYVRCTHDGKVIGSAFGRYIRRERIRSHFLREMEQPSQDMADIAFDLFTKHGCLKAKFKDHCVQQGTGVWGEELDYGPLLLIERAEITDREWRRKGLGKSMVNILIRKAEDKSKPDPLTPDAAMFHELFNRNEQLEKYSRLHTVVHPGWLRSDVEEQWKGKSEQEIRAINCLAVDAAVAFYRSTLGFRRIGASSFLGLSSDPTHKSHAIAVADDFDPPELDYEMLDDGDDDGESCGRAERMENRKLPLHDAAKTLPDPECLEYYKKAFVYQDEANWSQADHLKNNVLHVAALALKPLSVKWLLENVNVGNGLSSARNRDGFTPIEALQDSLDNKRTKMKLGGLTIDISDQFSGFPTKAVECLCSLAAPNAQELSSIQRERLTWGCTCGECLEGFISPRMKLALLYQAEVTFDMLDMDVEDGELWCMSNDYMLIHVDPDLRRNFQTNKSYRQGFTNIFNLVAACLRSDTVPKQDNVVREYRNGPNEWPPVTRNYLQRGGTMEGKIEPVLSILFDHAQDQDELIGDGDFERTMREEVSNLKACRNDREFGFVAVACGLPPKDYL